MGLYSIFGPVVTRWDVEQATVLTLQTWLSEYLTVVARQHPNLYAPLPALLNETVYGGADAETWQPSLGPGVIVLAEPDGDAIMFGSGDEAQWYEIRVHVLAQGGDENHARQLVDMYGAAVCQALAQHGDLSELAQCTVLMQSPMAEFIDPDERRFMQSQCVFRTLISPVVNSVSGPVTISAGTGAWPNVASASVTIIEMPASASVPTNGVLGYGSMTTYPEPVPDGP